MADVAIVIEQMKAKKKKQERIVGVESGVNTTSDWGDPKKPIQLAILGRQNVGKSSLVSTVFHFTLCCHVRNNYLSLFKLLQVNKLVNSERVLSGPLPGLTRDAIAIDYEWDGKKVQLVRGICTLCLY